MKDFGFTGLNIQPFVWEMPPNHKRLYPIYAKCLELDIPVAIHTGINYSPIHSMDFDRPIYLDEVLCDFPRLKMIACHSGWPWVPELIALARKHPNLYLEIGGVAPKYIAMPRTGWDPFLQYTNSLLRNQVLFGTDWPVISFKRVVEEFQQLPLKDEVKDKVLYKNAIELLGLD